MSGAIARLGHVLGWTGNGLAVLTLLFGLGATANTGWEYWNSRVTSALEAEYPDGSRYKLIGPTEDYGAIADAENALKKFRGEATTEDVKGQWTIFALDGQTPGDKERMNELQAAQRAMKWSKLRVNALRDGVMIALASIAIALLFYLVGRACRYILSGPKLDRPD